jgi:hypothetical protein
VRKIRIHLTDAFSAKLQSVAHAIEIGASEAARTSAMQHGHSLRVLLNKVIRDSSGTIR